MNRIKYESLTLLKVYFCVIAYTLKECLTLRRKFILSHNYRPPTMYIYTPFPYDREKRI